ncbi:MAG TPA: mucoidy inhibitor MuiA family protein [Anaeromyxobacteraceae bacterium]|nr:mucoidy inhibitor MuiA family protein [Anaeromyxobacteraceae bacterium]
MRPFALLAALAVAVPAPASAEDVRAASRIESVTVYRSSARVTRVAEARLGAGDGRVLLEGLPESLDDDSVRVSGKGTARAKIFGVSVERVTAEAPAAEVRAAEERLEGLLAEDRALEDAIRVARERAKFVESLRSTYSEERAKNLAVRGLSSREWAEMARLVEAELSASAASVRRSEASRRDLSRRIAAARADLEKLQAKRSRTTKTVAVELSADQAGTVEVVASYVVPGASWQPIWDARLVPEASTVEMAFLATVAQTSGEDWRGVRLALSTAEPGRGVFVPRLEPRWLERLQPVPLARKRALPMAAAPAAVAEAKADALAEGELGFAMEEPAASVEQGLLAATFTAPRRESVDGAGRARKVSLARFPLKAEIARSAAPRIDPAAFLTAKAVNDTGFPLLGGTAGVYVGDEFVGRAPLAFTPVGGELELAFGADDRIEIDRKVLERRHETAGVVSKDDVWRYRVRIAVKSRYPGPVALALQDLVPVSREEKIQVKVLEGSTPATREDPERPGVRIWDLSLEPRKEAVVELRYEVRFPRGFPVGGLE